MCRVVVFVVVCFFIVFFSTESNKLHNMSLIEAVDEIDGAGEDADMTSR